MKTKKIIRYRLSVSRTFPAKHKKKGEPTFFVEKIKATTLNSSENGNHIQSN